MNVNVGVMVQIGDRVRVKDGVLLNTDRRGNIVIAPLIVPGLRARQYGVVLDGTGRVLGFDEDELERESARDE